MRPRFDWRSALLCSLVSCVDSTGMLGTHCMQQRMAHGYLPMSGRRARTLAVSTLLINVDSWMALISSGLRVFTTSQHASENF